MKWDVDKELARFEPLRGAGTSLQRVLMGASVARKVGLKVGSGTQSVSLWCLGIGLLAAPKHFVYGRTIRECYLRLRHQVQSGLELNPKLFPRVWKKPAKKEKRRPPRKKETKE